MLPLKLLLHLEVVLVGGRGAEGGIDGDEGAGGVVAERSVIEGQLGIEALLDAPWIGRELVDIDGLHGAEGSLAEQAHNGAAIALGAIEDTGAAADDGRFTQLVGKAQTGGKRFAIGLDAEIFVGIDAGDEQLAGGDVEVGEAVGDFLVGREVFVAQADIDSEFLADLPVVLDEEAVFPAAHAGEDEGKVLLDGVGDAQEGTGHGVAGGAGVVGVVGEDVGEVEAAIAAVGLEFRDLAADDVATELDGVLAVDPAHVAGVLVGVFPAEDGQGAGVAEAEVAGGREDGQAIGAGALVGIFDAERFPELGAGCGPFGEEVEREALEAGLQFEQQRGGDGLGVVDDSVVGFLTALAGEGVLIAERVGCGDAFHFGRGESGGANGFGVLERIPAKEEAGGRKVVVATGIELVPVLALLGGDGVVVDDAGAGGVGQGVDEAAGDAIEGADGDLAVGIGVAGEAAGGAGGGAEAEGIEDVADGAEVAELHGGGGDGAEEGNFLAAAVAFVVAKVEQLVFDDRPADGGAELVLRELGLFGAGGGEVVFWRRDCRCGGSRRRRHGSHWCRTW